MRCLRGPLAPARRPGRDTDPWVPSASVRSSSRASGPGPEVGRDKHPRALLARTVYLVDEFELVNRDECAAITIRSNNTEPNAYVIGVK